MGYNRKPFGKATDIAEIGEKNTDGRKTAGETGSYYMSRSFWEKGWNVLKIKMMILF